jgi:hypothetical protein
MRVESRASDFVAIVMAANRETENEKVFSYQPSAISRQFDCHRNIDSQLLQQTAE